MVSHVVLGCEPHSRPVIDRIRASGDPVHVFTSDDVFVETLREQGVHATVLDSELLPDIESSDTPDLVFVDFEDPNVRVESIQAIADRHPESRIIAVLARGIAQSDREEVRMIADSVIDPDGEFRERITDSILGEKTTKAIELYHLLSSLDGPLAVVMHDNPDPDAIGSAVALTELAESVGTSAQPCYYGEISHQENRAMVNLLELDLLNLSKSDSLEDFSSFGLVDHSRPGINDQLPEELHIDVVIDHHPPRGPVPGTFTDIRIDAGSTSTVMTDHLTRLGVSISTKTASALLYGIRVDTNDFIRAVSPMDIEAVSRLDPIADNQVLQRIEAPSINADTFETIASAIKNRISQNSIVIANVGRIRDRDTLSQAAEHLLHIDGINTTLVFGVREEIVYLSGRSRADAVDIGETLRDAFDAIGSAGGHTDMAGAQIEVGMLIDETSEAGVSLDILEQVIADRFFETIRSRPLVDRHLLPGEPSSFQPDDDPFS